MKVHAYQNDLPQDEASLFQLDVYPLFDLEGAARILGGKEAFERLLESMLSKKMLDEDVLLIKQAHAKGDWERVQALAHKMKSGALYIGAIRMKMACQYLERYWKIGERAALEALYEQMLFVINETLLNARKLIDIDGGQNA